MYNADEAKEARTFLRPYLEPSFVPSPEYLASCIGERRHYTGNETPDQLKAMCAKFQDNYNKIVAALPEKLSVPVSQKRKILALTYRSGGHYHTAGAAGFLILMREAAKKYRAFEITEVYKPDGIDAKLLAGFDCVVVNCQHHLLRMGKYGVEWGLVNKHPEMKAEMLKRQDEERKIIEPIYYELLPAYVKNGGGLVGIHGAALIEMGNADKVTEYGAMIGGVVDDWCHPHGKKTTWGDYRNFSVKILEPGNPLAIPYRDWPAAGFTTEVYSFWLPKSAMNDTRALVRMDTDKLPEVVFNPKSEERCNDFASALVWIRSYGKGRVYYNVMGHDEEPFGLPCVARAMLDGLLYATGDLKVPDAPATASSARQ
jgi:type 1 glutamine amidotransferase